MAGAEAEYLKYIWAAYKKGDLEKQGVLLEQDQDPDLFKELLVDYLTFNGLDLNILLFDEKPIGMALYIARGRVLQLENLIWFSWASSRNVLEGSALFLDLARRSIDELSMLPLKVLIYSKEKDKKLFERLMDAGILARVGQVGKYFEDGTATLYATKEV